MHLGAPASNAENVTVPFADYIKNVASSEIYPSWNESAVRANIYAQISYALNRVYLEYYRSRGYNFDITNSTAIDQSFVNGRNIFDNIDRRVRFSIYISDGRKTLSLWLQNTATAPPQPARVFPSGEVRGWQSRATVLLISCSTITAVILYLMTARPYRMQTSHIREAR